MDESKSLVGTEWVAKYGSRAIRIERDYVYNNIRQFDVINLETRRLTRITMSGLKHKFALRHQVETSQ